MPQRVRKTKSARRKTTRWIIAGVVLCSAMTCVAPVLYASDCSRWIAEYKQGILQRKAAHRLRAAKYRLTALVHPQHPVHHHPMRRPMSPLEALRRFQIDCGDLETPPAVPKLPTPDLVAGPLPVEFPEVPPPDLPLPAVTEVAESAPPQFPDTYPTPVPQSFPPYGAPSFPYAPAGFPPAVPLLPGSPVTPPPVVPIVPASPVPEPGTIVLVATGVGLIGFGSRRRAARLG